MKKLFILILLIVLVVLGIFVLWPEKSLPEKENLAVSPTVTPRLTKTESLDLSPTRNTNMQKKYTAILNTSQGKIEIELFVDKTPITVNNFITLAKKNFYDNTIFHRIIKGFMIQGGDPQGDGTGGPGYTFADEPFEGEYKRGIIAMANAGPNTNGSQFFIMHQDNPLPKNYVIFGQVVNGMEVVDKIAEAPVVANSFGENSTPVTPDKILSTEILEK